MAPPGHNLNDLALDAVFRSHNQRSSVSEVTMHATAISAFRPRLLPRTANLRR
jgi:hypothetical protein